MNDVPTPPLAYAEGYAKACLYDQVRADNYIKHTTIGDPALDPVMEECSSLLPAELHRFIQAGMDQQDNAMRAAPKVLRDFFDTIHSPPPWLDYKVFETGIRAFHTNTTQILLAFICGVLIEGFSTLIAKSFHITGRVMYEPTQRRLKQNNRHLIEIFFPGGLQREGDGWKLSVRIRFVHAQVRLMMKHSDEWDTESWGIPISAAHLGYAISVFSMRLLEHSTSVGATFTREAQESVMSIWRYAGYLMGIPETILYTNMDDAKVIRKIAQMCEPPAAEESAAMANALIQSAPKIAGVTDPAEQHALQELAYRLSRSLIGNALADQLQFPKTRRLGTLFFYRLSQRCKGLLREKDAAKLENFSQLLQISTYDDVGLSYKIPDHVKHTLSSPW